MFRSMVFRGSSSGGLGGSVRARRPQGGTAGAAEGRRGRRGGGGGLGRRGRRRWRPWLARPPAWPGLMRHGNGQSFADGDGAGAEGVAFLSRERGRRVRQPGELSRHCRRRGRLRRRWPPDRRAKYAPPAARSTTPAAGRIQPGPARPRERGRGLGPAGRWCRPLPGMRTGHLVAGAGAGGFAAALDPAASSEEAGKWPRPGRRTRWDPCRPGGPWPVRPRLEPLPGLLGQGLVQDVRMLGLMPWMVSMSRGGRCRRRS